MLAEDVAPNRLAQAKTAARSLALAVQRDGGHRLGLLTFAGRADGGARSRATTGCSPAAGGRHHRRGRPARDLGSARRCAPGHAGVRRAHVGYTDLVLISDGEDHQSLPLEAAQMLRLLQVDLTTVGVGDPNRSVPSRSPRALTAAGTSCIMARRY